MMNRLTRTPRDIRALALCPQPGAIVLAEQAVDDHAALFVRLEDRLTALDALARDLFRIGRAEPALAPFLSRVDTYIGHLQQPQAA